MKTRLLTYSILLLLFLVAIKAQAKSEASEQNSILTFISAENSKQATDRIHLKSTDVNVNINGSIAEVTVKQQYKNNGDSIVSGKYTFPVPPRALLHGMQMKTGEEVFTAMVKEQKTAQKEYARFKEDGKNALLVKQDRPNLFSVNLSNVMPGETVDVELNYTELLTPRDMRYEFVYPTVSDPGYSDNPEAGFNIEVNLSAGAPIEELMCGTHDTDIILDTESSAKVLLKNPNKEGSSRNYVLNYRLEGKKMSSGLILSGGKDENFLLLNEYVGSPGLKDISVKFTDLKTYDLEPSTIPDQSDRRPITVIGKWKGEPDGLIKVQGTLNRRNYSKTYRFLKNNSRRTNGTLKHLWAGQRISHLSDFNTDNEYRDIKSEITKLGLNYNVLTNYTSLLAYNDVVRKKVTPLEEAKESLPPLHPLEEKLEPAPIRIAKVPEPGFYILLLILSSVLVTGNVRRKVVKVFSRIRLR